VNRLIPLTKWPEFHTWPSIGAPRYYVFNGEHNGFDKVFKRVGRRILLLANDLEYAYDEEKVLDNERVKNHSNFSITPWYHKNIRECE
jgi:hypothetical protein